MSAKKAVGYGTTGAVAGGAIGGPVGAAIGGGLGALGGALFGSDDDSAAQDAMAQSQVQLANLQKTQRAQRQQDLGRALGYFGPYNQLMNKMYGTPMPAPYMTDAQHVSERLKNMGAGYGFGNPPPPPPPPMQSGGPQLPNPGYRGQSPGSAFQGPAAMSAQAQADADRQARVRGYFR